jgi:uncharacterized membrane protein
VCGGTARVLGVRPASAGATLFLLTGARILKNIISPRVITRRAESSTKPLFLRLGAHFKGSFSFNIIINFNFTLIIILFVIIISVFIIFIIIVVRILVVVE